MWESTEVRGTFLDFFAGKKHARLLSFPLIPPAGDTTLWISAGMQPFKAEFAGIAKPISPRITTCQKCVRADDIDRVGHTTRHHTFFEMLGNFSFGDYFKEEAIGWAWELLTEKYKLPKERLWVSIHTDDDEAEKIWKKETGLVNPIHRLSDNWWGPIGSTGTCGPDSEIYFDRGEPFSCGKPGCRPGCENKNSQGVDCDRYIELWNLVFTMYHKDEAGKFHELPRKNIDTGAGLERLTMVLQEKPSPFETDLFGNVWRDLRGLPRPDPANQLNLDIAARIVADHLRAAVFMIADGAVPSNEGRGYVLRKILRRAYIYFRSLPVRSFPVSDYAVPFINSMGGVYPELTDKRALIKDTIQTAIAEFQNLLENCEQDLWSVAWNLVKAGTEKKVSGEVLFRFHDERGLPFEVAKDLLQSKDFVVDEEGFKREMDKQRERSRGSRGESADLLSKREVGELKPTSFLGYQSTEADAVVVALHKRVHQGGKTSEQPVETLIANEEGIAVLDQTPFYAESGGQVGDTGTLAWDGGSADVLDTQKNEGGTYFHRVRVVSGKLAPGLRIRAAVDEEKRAQIRKHHTATHLLHAALREVLGPHVQQAGSYVCDHYLRLDFSHPHALSAGEFAKIEAVVNEKSCANIPVETRVTGQQEAKELGALAFFGEKYGDRVRVVMVDAFSKELCGGTHAAATGEIGPFVLVRESSIAKGVRRIEAKAGKAAVEYIGELQRVRAGFTERLKADLPDLVRQLDLLLGEKQEKEKEIRRLKQELAARNAAALLERKEPVNGFSLIAERVEVDEKESLRVMVDALKEKIASGIILLASPVQEKISLVCGVTPDLVKQGFSAVEIIKQVSRIVGGGGGGRPDLAEAGGKDPAKLDAALAEARKIIASRGGALNR